MAALTVRRRAPAASIVSPGTGFGGYPGRTLKRAAAPTRLICAFNWDDLRYFLELARRGRLAVVARHLGVEHTTVSRRITELEGVLEEKLFDRTPKGYRLTPVGEHLVRYTEQMEAAAYGIADSAGIAHARVESP